MKKDDYSKGGEWFWGIEVRFYFNVGIKLRSFSRGVIWGFGIIRGGKDLVEGL